MKDEFSIPRLAALMPTEADAYAFLEDMRWGGRPVCPHCESLDGADFIKPRNGVSRTTRTGSQSQRRLWQCKSCRQQYSVLTGTVMHGTKISIRTWVFVFYEMCASKNGIAAREVERKYGLSPKSAWFLTQRIREAMMHEPMAGLLAGTIVADEAFIGGLPKTKHRQGRPAPTRYGRPYARNKYLPEETAVISLVDKATHEVRSRVVTDVTAPTLADAIRDHVDVPNSILHTDASKSYRPIGQDFKEHEYVDHSSYEYVRGEVSTNMLENYFSQLKRSIDGTHHRVSSVHLERYLAEFDYRYTYCQESDSARMRRLFGKVGGKRLTYRPISEGE